MLDFHDLFFECPPILFQLAKSRLKFRYLLFERYILRFQQRYLLYRIGKPFFVNSGKRNLFNPIKYCHKYFSVLVLELLKLNVPNARAKRRGGKAPLRSQNVTPRPLERPVGRPGLREKAEVAWLLHFAPPHSAQYAEYRYCAFCCVAVNTSVKASNKSCSALRALSKWKTIEPKSSACSFISAILRLALITDFVSLYCSGE